MHIDVPLQADNCEVGGVLPPARTPLPEFTALLASRTTQMERSIWPSVISQTRPEFSSF